MWTRKSQQETQIVDQEAELKRTSLLRPIYWAAPISLLCMVLYSFGYRGGLTRGVIIYSDPISLFGSRSIFVGLFGFVFLYVLMYISQRRGGLFSGDDILLCGSCQEPAHATVDRRCECGGRLEPFEYYQWEEEEVAPSSQHAQS